MQNRNQSDFELRQARKLWGRISSPARCSLLSLVSKYQFSVIAGDLLLLGGRWYVTYSGLLNLANRKRCLGISVEPLSQFCDFATARYAFKATVYTSHACRGFSGFGDADPSNVSPFLRGAELRIAETRAVNRALRKAYGIGICSVEEIGSSERQQAPERPVRKLAPESANGNGGAGRNVNGDGSRVRDRLCQIIRQHKLDAELVKAYAVDFCGTKTLREASRQKVEGFVAHLDERAAKDRDALLSQLNSYSRLQAGAA